LIENLELARALSKRDDVSKLKRRFKKFLKQMSDLRDLQVQLENVARLPRSQALSNFTERLQRLERQEIENIQNKLKRIKRRRLTHTFKDVRSELFHSQERASTDRAYHSIRRVLTSRHNEFIRAKRRFHRLQPLSEDALHEMRIALKKLRYTMEAAHPMLVESEKERIGAMRAFQKLMGDSRDLEMLRADLETWAKKKGKKTAVVPALQDLEEKRDALLRKVLESSRELETILHPAKAAPVTEKTEVGGHTAAAAAAGAGVRLSPDGTSGNPT
jgi:CHAD domain-containing protein